MTMQKLTAGDADTQSADLIAENIDKLKALFPELVTEGSDGAAINVDVLKQLVGDATVTEADEKYGLNWFGKRRARQLALTPSTGTLRPCPEDSVDWDSTQNLMIEGDNLEVLKLLQKSYAGKVKLIYIDPPYNTGKDFVYPDNYRDNIKNYMELTGQVEGGAKISSNNEASGRFHAHWLNMMYARLKLAHSLLRKDGFLFINIDDDEAHRLHAAINEIFGEENFIANVVWEKKYTRANDARFFSDNHDHILVVSRNKEESALGNLPRNDEQLAAYRNPDGHTKGPWKATPLHAKSGSSVESYRFANSISWQPPAGTYRRYSDETMQKLEEDDAIWFGIDNEATPSRKSFLSDVKSGVTPVTIWPCREVGHNHEANSELSNLVGSGIFSNPKPCRLIERIIQLSTATCSVDLMMDFFAGSGTTGHAIMAQNAADGGNRKYILVQLPEPLDPANKDQKVAADFCDQLNKPRNIAELTKERLRRAGTQIKQEHPDWNGDTGFRVFKLDSSNIHAWDPQPEDLEAALFDAQEHVKADRSEQDVLYELLLKLGLDLCVPIESRTFNHETHEMHESEKESAFSVFRDLRGSRVFSVGGGVLLACLAEKISINDVEALAQGIVAWHEELKPAGDATCVFRDSAFAGDVAKTNMAAILEQHGIANVRSL